MRALLVVALALPFSSPSLAESNIRQVLQLATNDYLYVEALRKARGTKGAGKAATAYKRNSEKLKNLGASLCKSVNTSILWPPPSEKLPRSKTEFFAFGTKFSLFRVGANGVQGERMGSARELSAYRVRTTGGEGRFLGVHVRAKAKNRTSKYRLGHSAYGSRDKRRESVVPVSVTHFGRQMGCLRMPERRVLTLKNRLKDHKGVLAYKLERADTAEAIEGNTAQVLYFPPSINPFYGESPDWGEPVQLYLGDLPCGVKTVPSHKTRGIFYVRITPVFAGAEGVPSEIYGVGCRDLWKHEHGLRYELKGGSCGGTAGYVVGPRKTPEGTLVRRDEVDDKDMMSVAEE